MRIKTVETDKKILQTFLEMTESDKEALVQGVEAARDYNEQVPYKDQQLYQYIKAERMGFKPDLDLPEQKPEQSNIQESGKAGEKIMEERETKYLDGHDCPFEAFITNLGKYAEGTLEGEWIKFPTSHEKLQETLTRIGIGSTNQFGAPYEEWFISDYSCFVSNLSPFLGEYDSVDELNYLAAKLNELPPDELLKFEQAVRYGDYTSNLEELINLTDNLDCYEFYPGITNEEDLGHYYADELEAFSIPEEIKLYFDYEAYGRDIRINEGGAFYDEGYVYHNGERFEEVYNRKQHNLPEEYKVTSKPEQSNPQKNQEQDKVNNIPRQQIMGTSR